MSQQNQVIFNGRYELHRRLGRGGMAEVYLARDQLLDRPVAVKVLFPALATDAGFVERFRREAQAAANLQHPNIVSVFDWGEANGTYFIVMEYVEGHRDVKPGNVLITPDGGVKVADFGIARALSDSSDQNLTKTGSVMGTATYFSPEQARGAQVDPRSDLYSLGVVLYEMITGHPPFSGDSAVAIAYKHVQENPTPPRHIDPALPETLEAITLKCLAKNPANRYPSAQDLRADLRRYLDGSRILAEPVLAPPIDPGATGVLAPTGYGDQTALVSGPVGYQPDYDDYDDYDDYADEEEPKRSKWFLVAMVLLLLVLAGLLFLLASNFNDTEDPVEQVTVPLVEGKPVQEATTLLEAEGFEVNQEFEASDRPANEVIKQDPAPSEKADLGSTVTLTVSQGPEPVLVPDVTGKTAEEANQVLVAAGLLVNQVAVEDDTVEEGHVVSQDPPGGGEVPPNTQVTINVSSGAGTVPVPDVVGKTEGEARTALQGAGLTNITTQQQASGDVEAGRVISSNPSAGQEVAADQAITLVVSSGQETVLVPPVQNLSESNARSALEDAGLSVEVAQQDVANPGQDKQVLSQSPAAGQEVTRGSTVTIYVGVYREPEDPPISLPG
jgi:serine/threonine-protein kinase